MNIDWNACDYARDFSFVPRYGEDVLSLLDPGAGKRVVDLGCGNGRLTKRLAEMGMDVTGIDASGEMLGVARATYPELTFRQADALDFSVTRPVDAVFSNAVFHWIDRDLQPRLLRQVNRALRMGGQLVCEFGGRGCAQRVHDALRQAFHRRGLDYTFRFFFPTIGEYAPLLEQAGFRVTYATLFDRPTTCANGESGLRDWVRMFDRLPFRSVGEAEEAEILGEAEEALRGTLFSEGSWHVDYVRIRLKAIKETQL